MCVCVCCPVSLRFRKLGILKVLCAGVGCECSTLCWLMGAGGTHCVDLISQSWCFYMKTTLNCAVGIEVSTPTSSTIIGKNLTVKCKLHEKMSHLCMYRRRNREVLLL